MGVGVAGIGVGVSGVGVGGAGVVVGASGIGVGGAEVGLGVSGTGVGVAVRVGTGFGVGRAQPETIVRATISVISVKQLRFISEPPD